MVNNRVTCLEKPKRISLVLFEEMYCPDIYLKQLKITTNT